MSLKQTLIIIGSGITGLSAGIWSQLQGMKTIILEKNAEAGGQLAGIGYGQNSRFEYDLEGLVGTKSTTKVSKMWQSLGVTKENTLVFQPESLFSVEENGKQITLWQDLDRFAKELIELSPDDKDAVLKFCDNVHTVQDFDEIGTKPKELNKLFSFQKLTDAQKALEKASQITMPDFYNQFHHPLIRRLFSESNFKFGFLDSFLYIYAMFTSRNYGMPVGGPSKICSNLKKRYYEVGGKLITNAEVKRILISRGCARGVLLKSGKYMYSNKIICACDTYHALTDLVPREKLNSKLIQKLWGLKHNDEDLIFKCIFSTKNDTGMLLHSKNIEFQPFNAGNTLVQRATIIHSGYDPYYTLNKEVQISVLISQKSDSFEYWKSLYHDNFLYNTECSHIIKKIKEILKAEYPYLDLQPRGCITPYSMYRMYRTYYGKMDLTVDKKIKMAHPFSRKLPKTKNLYFCGPYFQRLPSLNAAAADGKYCVQLICKNLRKSFAEPSF